MIIIRPMSTLGLLLLSFAAATAVSLAQAPAPPVAFTLDRVLDYPFPCTFDAEAKHWDFNDACSWDDVLERWRGRGPRNAAMVAELQESYYKLRNSRGR